MGSGSMIGRIMAALAGLLFLVLAVLLLVGFGSLAQYPLWMRLLLALLIAAYGVWRARRGWRPVDSAGQN